MPPRYLRRASLTRLKYCAERMVETCDTTMADGCCGVIPCKLCLEWEVYGEDIAYGSADFATSSWTGTVGGGSFVAYWERNYDSGECEFIVIFDDQEVYRATCYDGASCRNPAGEASASIGYDEGTLRWSVYEPRELALIDNPDTGCRDFFCGSCRCSCECICVTITEYGGEVITGELCDIAYGCDPPTWAGTVGYYELSFSLGRDQYGECIITATVDGEEQESVAASGCASMHARIITAGGDIIDIRCKQCSCEQCPDAPCDCEFSNMDNTCYLGSLVSTTIPGDTCAGSVIVGSVITTPATVAWVVGEDLIVPVRWEGFHITIPCGLMPLILTGVLVRRSSDPSGPSPYVDDDIVQPCEYYFVMYDEFGAVASINYEYELCCGQSEAAPPCQTRLAWIRFLDVPAGRGIYDFLFWNQSGPSSSGGNGVLVGECPFSDGPNPCS